MFEGTNISYHRLVTRKLDLEELESRAWRAFLQAQARVIPALEAELVDEQSLTLSQYEVLLRLAKAPGRAMRMLKLAESVLLSPSGITRVIDELERKDLVERKRCPSDGRGYLAVLTTKGRARLRRAAAVHVRGIREHFTDRLTPRQLQQLASALEAAFPSTAIEEAG